MNPPIRPREDVEFLWEALLAGELDWVVSDHACCRHEMKIPKRYFGNIWMAKSGFGGTEYLLPALVSEGTRRGMSYNHMARVTSWNPAQRFGLNRKGDIAEGFDADIALVDPARTWTIARQGLALDPGLHAVRGAGAVGASRCDLPARHEDLRGRPGDRQAARPVPAPPDGVNAMRRDSDRRQRPADAARHARGAGGHRRRGRLRADGRADAARCRHRLACCWSATRAPQGSTALSSGFIPAAGTRVQRAAGVTTTAPTASRSDIQAKAHGTAAPHLVAAYAGAIAPAMDALQSRHGLRVRAAARLPLPGPQRAAHARPAAAHRRRTVAALDAAAVRAGAMLMTDARVRELWRRRRRIA